jgi:hypothetical protein
MSVEVYSLDNKLFPFWIPVSQTFTIKDTRDMISSYLQRLYEGGLFYMGDDNVLSEFGDDDDENTLLYHYPFICLYIDARGVVELRDID